MSSLLKMKSLAVTIAVLPLLTFGAAAQTPGAKLFSTPEMAVAAFVDAARSQNKTGVLSILARIRKTGLISGDNVQDDQDRVQFIAAFDKSNRLDLPDDETAILHVGEDDYPFPFPVVKLENGWSFDAEEGREEILDRRIGENELNAMQVIQAIADAQIEYSTVDWDEDGMLEYASPVCQHQRQS